MCVVRLCAAACFVHLHDSRYTDGELYADAWPCTSAGVCRCKCDVSVCFSLYEALLKLDQRCCTVHSFIFNVMNILLSSSYQLQFISLDGCTVHILYLVSDLTVL